MNDKNFVSFHMLFDFDLFLQITKQAKLRRMGFSGFINMAFRESVFLLDKADMTNGILETDADFNEDDLDVDIDRKVFIDRDLKYRLQHFQDHFKIWSKAAVLRYILRRFLRLLERYGEVKVKGIRDRFFRMWERAKGRTKGWTKYFSESFLRKTHMENFYIPDRIEIVNSYGVTYKIIPLTPKNPQLRPKIPIPWQKKISTCAIL